MPADITLAGGYRVPASELSWRFSRSQGPGGQSVNTADSRVELVFDLAGSAALPRHLQERALQRLSSRLVNGRIVVVAERERSQLRNRSAAAQRLRAILEAAIAAPAPPRRPTRPSRGAVERRLADKRRRAQAKLGRRTTE